MTVQGAHFLILLKISTLFPPSFLVANWLADQLFLGELVWVQAAGQCGLCHCCFLLPVFL